jgi:glycosyltransferase involved in cell wall biosynthesis
VEPLSKYSIRNPSRIPDAPPVVKPLDASVRRPQWSVMIPVYNCSGYLRETLERVLAQDQGELRMQIEVVDDASSDADVYSVVQEVGRGRVSYFCQKENVGSLRNFHTCLERSSGHLIHILHGDDLIRDGFYEKMEVLFAAHRSIGAAFCRYSYIDERGKTLFCQDAEGDHAGILDNWLARLCERQRIQYVSMVVKREVYEHLGGFYGVEYGEDWEMWVRIAAHYPMAYTPEVLAEYRKHYASISGNSFVTGQNMASLEWVMERIRQYLPANVQKPVMRASRNFYAHYALRVANALWKNFKDRRGASAQASAAWSMSRDAGLLFKIIKLYTRITLNI